VGCPGERGSAFSTVLTIRLVSSRPATAQHLRDLALLRRVRDRIDREYAKPLDVEALAREAHMSAGQFSREFRAAYGESPYSYLMTRRIERAMALLRRVRDRIDREYAKPLDVEALARDAHMSAGHFSREFRAAYGESPYSYLMTRRIERAMALLRRGGLSVTEVCFAVGCSSLGTFSTRFTELVGMPPSAYARQATGAMAGIAPCVAKQVTRPVRNREAAVAEPH
jgi:AraC-like DNA-binding protein